MRPEFKKVIMACYEWRVYGHSANLRDAVDEMILTVVKDELAKDETAAKPMLKKNIKTRKQKPPFALAK